MNQTKLPLADRLERLSQNGPAYPEHTVNIIQRVANTPITAYLRQFEAELNQLRQIIEPTEGDLGQLTYQDVAARICEMYRAEGPSDRAVQALELLAAPLINEYRLYGMEEV